MNNFERLTILSKEVRKLIVSTKRFNDHTLEGGCGTSSFHLLRCAKKNGITVRFVHGLYYKEPPSTWGSFPHWHAWIEYKNHIFDITRRQFESEYKNKPLVSIVSKDKVANYYKSPVGIVTSNISDAYLQIKDWAYYPKKLRENLILVP